MSILEQAQSFLSTLLEESILIFTTWMVDLVPMILLVMTIMNTIALCIGENRIKKLAGFASRNVFIRYMILPFFGAIVLCNPMALSLGKYLPEKYKPSYFASASYFCHTSNGVFQHINPSELMIWVGISTGVSKAGNDIFELAWAYLLVGLIVNFISGFITDYTTLCVCNKTGIILDEEIPVEVFTMERKKKHTVRIERGSAGFGGPLIITPDEKRNKIIYILGNDCNLDVIHKIAKITGGKIVDCAIESVPDDEVMVAIIDCAGTLRCGIYPKKNIPTINVLPTGKSGPLAKYISEDIYVSDVSVATIRAYGESKEDVPQTIYKQSLHISFLIARFMSILMEAAKSSVNSVVKTILPFIIVISLLIGMIEGSEIGVFIANQLLPLVGNEIGLLLIGVICALPFLSPILSPGAVMAQVVGVFIGLQIGEGNLPAYLALPALFAINTQAACDIIPVALGLAEAKSETIQVGIPSILQSRFITSFIRVLIAIMVSFLLFR